MWWLRFCLMPLFLMSFCYPAFAQDVAQCFDGSETDLRASIKLHVEHVWRLSDKFLNNYYNRGPIPSDLQDEIDNTDIVTVHNYLKNAELSKRHAAVIFYALNPHSNKLCSWLILSDTFVFFVQAIDESYLKNLRSCLLRKLRVEGSAVHRGAEHIDQHVICPHNDLDEDALVEKISSILLPANFVNKLRSKRIDTLIVVPIFDIGSIPFSVLDFDQGKLVETMSVVVAPGFPMFHENLASLTQITRAVVVGDPEASRSGFYPLRGAREEAKQVAAMYDSEPLLGQDATKNNVQRQIETSRAELIYFATHALADANNPRDGSFILLADGPWLGREIQNLNLRDISPLVVLSACSTSLGKDFDVGTIGLTRTWYRAGARNVVMSLWNLVDMEMPAVMKIFMYSVRSLPPDKALQKSMNQARSEGLPLRSWAGLGVFGTLVLPRSNQ